MSAITVAIRGTGSYGAFLRSVRPVLISSLAVHVPAIVVLAYAYRQASEWTVVAVLRPWICCPQPLQALPRTASGRRGSRCRQHPAAACEPVLCDRRSSPLWMRETATPPATRPPSLYTRETSLAGWGRSDDDQRLVHLCGLVHDIGKIGLPPGLLEKPGALTLDERRQMEQHSEIGERILAKVEDYGGDRKDRPPPPRDVSTVRVIRMDRRRHYSRSSPGSSPSPTRTTR